jgi:hypothetical protein
MMEIAIVRGSSSDYQRKALQLRILDAPSISSVQTIASVKARRCKITTLSKGGHGCVGVVTASNNHKLETPDDFVAASV